MHAYIHTYIQTRRPNSLTQQQPALFYPELSGKDLLFEELKRVRSEYVCIYTYAYTYPELSGEDFLFEELQRVRSEYCDDR